MFGNDPEARGRGENSCDGVQPTAWMIVEEKEEELGVVGDDDGSNLGRKKRAKCVSGKEVGIYECWAASSEPVRRVCKSCL